MTINNLWRLVLKKVFAPDSLKSGEAYLMENAIEKWYQIVKMHNVKLADAFGDIAFKEAVGRRGSVTDEIEYQLELMCKLLVDDEKGLLEDKKETYKRHSIDYRKVLEYRNIFPEMWPTKKELAQAREYKRKNDLDNKRLLN
jgi:hypothetical protein